MQSLRRHNGFTLIELMLVVAIIAILSATAGPFLLRLAIREDARANSQRIAGLLSQLRARASDRGVNQNVIFQNPMQFRQAGAPTPVIATIIQDLDGDWTLSAGDIQSPFLAVPKTNPAVTGYGVAGLQPFGPAPLAPVCPAAPAAAPAPGPPVSAGGGFCGVFVPTACCQSSPIQGRLGGSKGLL